MSTESNSIHPYLLKPILHVGGVKQSVSNLEIVESLRECLRLRPTIVRTGNDSDLATGSIEFEDLHKAEKAYSTVAPHFPEHDCTLSLHITSPTVEDPLPNAIARIVLNLPLDSTAGELFDLFRPFGPIFRANLRLTKSEETGLLEFQTGIGSVIFYSEEDAKKATEALHCFDYKNSTITVKKIETPRNSKKSNWAEAPAFVLPSTPLLPLTLVGKGIPTSLPSHSSNSTPTPTRTFSSTSQISMHSSSTTSPTPSNTSTINSNAYSTPMKSTLSTNSNSNSTPPAIDQSNLFIKSLSPEITSRDLELLFQHFGPIISAKVELNDSGKSKGFGFVSFKNSEDAAKAMEGMDGKALGCGGFEGKKVVVRVLVPKSLRGELVKQTSGNTSPASSDVELSSPSLPSTPVVELITPTKVKEEISIASPSSPALALKVLSSTIVSPIGMSEHERLLLAVKKIDAQRAEELVEMIQGLPKKEIALCLFNPDYLRTKVSDALLVLSALEEEEEAEALLKLSSPSPPLHFSFLPTPASTPQAKEIGLPIEIPSSPIVQSVDASLPLTLAELGKLPASTIISLIHSGKLSTSLGISKVTLEKESETNEFMDNLISLKIQELKQKLGDRLFKAVKVMGVKGAPKITINLLDKEELRGLAHLIDYPVVLREKVLDYVSSSVLV